jgi:xylulokinase
MSLLGIDIGAAGCKAAAYTLEGVLLAQASHAYEATVRRDGMHELDSREVWAAVREVIARVAAQTTADPIQALSVASLAEAVVPISFDGQLVGPCLLGCDAARQPYVDVVRDKLGEQRLFDITGQAAAQGCVLHTLCWLRDKAPDTYAAAWRFMSWSGLAGALLGGRALCDLTVANRSLLFDMNQRRWSRPVLEAAGLAEGKLPELETAGTPAGTLAPALARELGLPPNVRLILGGHDPCCTALGAGVVHPGLALYELGAQMRLLVTFEALPLTSMMLARGLSLAYHVLPGLYVSLVQTAGGSVLRWFRDQLAPLEARESQRRGLSAYDELLAEMPEDPTRLLALPHFAPGGAPVSDLHAAGALIGLRLDTTRGEMLKALLEGMAFSVAQGLASYGEMGLRVERLRAAGGGARSAAWLQLSADVLGLPVELPEVAEATTLGAALLAGLGAGAYGNAEEAVRVAVRVKRRYEPDASHQTRYREKLARNVEVEALLRGLG